MSMTSGWGAPARAYELTASAAENGWAAAGSALASMDTGELAGLVTALGAQARQAAVIATGPGIHLDRAREVLAGQRAALRMMFSPPAARRITEAALEGDGPAEGAPAAELRESATCLLAVITGTLRAGGWAPATIAFYCRRNAAGR